MDRINKEYIYELINNLSNYKDTDVMLSIRKQAQNNQLPILRRPVACLLDILVRSSKPQNILEIGTSIGYSTMVMLNALGETGKIYTMEMDDKIADMAINNFRQAGALERVKLFWGDAKEILYYMEGSFDFIFMDGPKAQYLNYLPYCLDLLKPGGLLVCDDVLFYGMVADKQIINRRKITIVKRMKKFLKIISYHPDLNTAIVPLGDGVSISYKKEA